MAEPFGVRPTLAELIYELETLGCSIIDLSEAMYGPRGPIKVRYVKRPTTGGHCTLPNIPIDERVAIPLIETIERRLGVKTRFTR